MLIYLSRLKMSGSSKSIFVDLTRDFNYIGYNYSENVREFTMRNEKGEVVGYIKQLSYYKPYSSVIIDACSDNIIDNIKMLKQKISNELIYDLFA